MDTPESARYLLHVMQILNGDGSRTGRHMFHPVCSRWSDDCDGSVRMTICVDLQTYVDLSIELADMLLSFRDCQREYLETMNGLHARIMGCGWDEIGMTWLGGITDTMMKTMKGIVGSKGYVMYGERTGYDSLYRRMIDNRSRGRCRQYLREVDCFGEIYTEWRWGVVETWKAYDVCRRVLGMR